MRSANWITFYAGCLFAVAYLVGSAISSRPRSGERQAAQQALVEAATAVGWAVGVYVVIDRIAPGSDRFRDFSAVGFLSPKALTVWESLALWAGLAIVIGLIIPFRSGFRRGSTGLAPGAALLLLNTPLTFFLTMFAWFAAQTVMSRRSAVLTALGAAATVEWALSFIPQTVVATGWGVIHGPESTLWVTALAGVLAARQSHEPSRLQDQS
ncbi:MAG: glycerol-3-phosphate acyltransferase PlsY [Acidimicrobiales bacterium]